MVETKIKDTKFIDSFKMNFAIYPTTLINELFIQANYKVGYMNLIIFESYNQDETLYFAGFLIRMKVKRDYDAKFIFQSTLTQHYIQYISITSQRSGQPGVNANEYSELKLCIPKNREEQKSIGLFFQSLDHLITLHQREYLLLEVLLC